MQTLMIITIVLAVLVIGLGVITWLQSRRITKLSAGNSAASLEDTIGTTAKNLRELGKKVVLQGKQIEALRNDAFSNIQNVGVVRFNPFKETGGSQSFAVALTDKNNTGVVISSLYARERMSVFAKPIVEGSSEYTLTKEEELALEKSKA